MQDLALYFRIGRMLGDTTDWPQWLPGDEFLNIREESCAASSP